MKLEEREYLTRQMKAIHSKDPVIVELGSWKGTSSIAIATGIKKYCKSAKFYCIDMFSQEYYAATPGLELGTQVNMRDVFEKNMKDFPHVTLQMESLKAVDKFDDKSIDFIFIDADHSYEGVKSDILAWAPKMKPGSTICGHDHRSEYPGVEKAVKEIFVHYNLPARTIWEVHL